MEVRRPSGCSGIDVFALGVIVALNVTAMIPDSVRPFWDSFQATSAIDLSPRFYESFYFGDSAPVADQLAMLVLSGAKRATTSLVWGLEAEQKQPPRAGGLSVMTDGQGRPRCVIETQFVDILPFGDVSAEFAAREGEGDRSLAHWREVHWAFFGRECRRIGREPSVSMLVVCEQFSVVFREGGPGAAEITSARP